MPLEQGSDAFLSNCHELYPDLLQFEVGCRRKTRSSRQDLPQCDTSHGEFHEG
jgi:hypothetical protein